jgi:hypothetical protein
VEGSRWWRDGSVVGQVLQGHFRRLRHLDGPDDGLVQRFTVLAFRARELSPLSGSETSHLSAIWATVTALPGYGYPGNVEDLGFLSC